MASVPPVIWTWLGIAMVVVIVLDALETLVITQGTTTRWRPTRAFYHWAWLLWRVWAKTIRDERRRERSLSVFGPLSMLGLLLMWLLGLDVGWALIYRGALGQMHGASDFLSLLYYSGSTLLTPSFGEVTRASAPGGLLSLVET
ncbi:MAG: hypothetical protein JOZ39_10980, partial [Chloroflexi bacterium]|nr:hypothetical protein [Chloroflexota bacterium]